LKNNQAFLHSSIEALEKFCEQISSLPN